MAHKYKMYNFQLVFNTLMYTPIILEYFNDSLLHFFVTKGIILLVVILCKN